MWHAGRMAQDVCPIVSGDDRARLEAIVADRNRAHKHVLRARIVLHSAERLRVAEVARRVGVSRPAVWRWQQRFAEAGVDGLLRDKTRKPGKAPLDDATGASGGGADLRRAAGRGHALDRPRDGERRPASPCARCSASGQAHDLQPHRLRSFKRSSDPDFAEKLEDDRRPLHGSAHARVVLSIDEKSQIQALDRTQPGLPLKPGKAGR